MSSNSSMGVQQATSSMDNISKISRQKSEESSSDKDPIQESVKEVNNLIDKITSKLPDQVSVPISFIQRLGTKIGDELGEFVDDIIKPDSAKEKEEEDDFKQMVANKQSTMPLNRSSSHQRQHAKTISEKRDRREKSPDSCNSEKKKSNPFDI